MRSPLLFDRYRVPVYRAALALTGDPGASEEVLLDTFGRAYTHRRRLRTDVSPLPWLHKVALNLCYSRLGRRRLRSEPVTDIVAERLVDGGARPDTSAEWSELCADRARGHRRPVAQAPVGRDPLLPRGPFAPGDRRRARPAARAPSRAGSTTRCATCAAASTRTAASAGRGARSSPDARGARRAEDDAVDARLPARTATPCSTSSIAASAARGTPGGPRPPRRAASAASAEMAELRADDRRAPPRGPRDRAPMPVPAIPRSRVRPRRRATAGGGGGPWRLQPRRCVTATAIAALAGRADGLSATRADEADDRPVSGPARTRSTWPARRVTARGAARYPLVCRGRNPSLPLATPTADPAVEGGARDRRHAARSPSRREAAGTMLARVPRTADLTPAPR